MFPRLLSHSRQILFNYYFITLIAMIVFLVGAILAHMNQLDGVPRAVFAALFALGLYLLFRGVRARTVLLLLRDDWPANYIDHMGSP